MCLLVVLSLLRSYILSNIANPIENIIVFLFFSIVTKHKVPAADNKKKISEKVELL